MEPYMIVSLLVVLVAVLFLGAEAKRLERENCRLRLDCIMLCEIAKSLFAVSNRVIDFYDELDRNNLGAASPKFADTGERAQ